MELTKPIYLIALAKRMMLRQWNDKIKTGDTLVIESEGVVGLADTWLSAITDEFRDLHSVNRETATPSSHAYSCGITAEQIAHAYYIKSGSWSSITRRTNNELL